MKQVLSRRHRHKNQLHNIATKIDLQRRRIEKMVFVPMLLMIISWIIVGLSIPDINAAAMAIFFLCGAVGVGLGMRGSWLDSMAARLLSESLQEKLEQDPRPPIIYLRPFSRDLQAAKVYKYVWFGSFSMNTWVETITDSEEQHLAKTFEEIGPFVALGNPADSVAALGAARQYLDHNEDWKGAVDRLMANAAMCIMNPGKSESFIWELQRATEKLPPARLLLCISLDDSEYLDFRNRTKNLFPVSLPIYIPGNRKMPTSIKGFLYFECDWNPRFLRMPVKFRHWIVPNGGAYLSSVLQKTLQPYLQQLSRVNSSI